MARDLLRSDPWRVSSGHGQLVRVTKLELGGLDVTEGSVQEPQDSNDRPLVDERHHLATNIWRRRASSTGSREDLVWLPTFFIADAVLLAATRRACAALRPGGWILYPTGSNAAANPQQSAVFGLLTHLWGGPTLSVERAESLLKEAGFASVRTVPGPAWAPAMVIGQREA